MPPRPPLVKPSLLSDLTQVLRGAGRVGGLAAERALFDLDKKVVNPAAKTSGYGVEVAREALLTGGKRDSGPSPEAVAEKLVLTVENTAVFAAAAAQVLPTLLGFTDSGGVQDEDSAQSGQKPRRKKKRRRSGDEHEYTLHPERTAMDLIQRADLTSRESIRREAFIRKPVEEEEVTPEHLQTVGHDETGVNLEWRQEKKLSSTASEQSVPSGRLSRIASFGSLGVGLGLGTVAEYSKRLVGISDSSSSVFLSEANAERIVGTLCRVRGAALKIGQILSIQDEAFLSPELAHIFQRVRESADFMPQWQLEKVMSSELGADWREKHFSRFEDRPFAAASIGQVHAAALKSSGLEVAVKVQYPGVAKGIDSDIDNMLALLNYFRLIPEGFFIDSIVKHMKIELSQECDYEREAECCRRMGETLKDWPELYVPRVIDELSTKQVFTTEMIEGLTIDQCVELSQSTRDHITEVILRLLLKELFIYRYMQTDPNWANFLYNPETHKLGLLDFGATREFRPFFVDNYFRIIDGAARGDRDAVLEYSRVLGFLTGHESSIMNDAHVESVMILGECFRENRPYDFGHQRVTQRMQELVPVMLKHRLCPPPPEVYSLHRKMSGLFLLATKLQSVLNCYPLWQKIREEYHEVAKTATKSEGDNGAFRTKQ